MMYSPRHRFGASNAAFKSIDLPQSMPAGAVIGRGGQNIRILSQRTGARIIVSGSGTSVEVSGSSSAVQAAEQLLRLQVEAFLSSGGGYPHPLQVHYLLSKAFGSAVNRMLVFQPRQDAVARATDRREMLYQLQPSAFETTGVSPGVDGLASISQALMGMRLSGDSKGIPMHLYSEEDHVVQQMMEAAEKGIMHKPEFDEMKIRFNFGKSLWYRGTKGGALHSGLSWSIKDMQSKEIPSDVKSVYSNAIQPEDVSRLQNWLLSNKFQQTETKERASVHVLHQGLNASYTLSFNKDRQGGLTLRKVKSGNNKLFFLTLLAEANQPDWRAKLLAQHHFKEDSDLYNKLSSIAASARLSSPNKVAFADLRQHDMTVDRERHKSKTIYQGSFSTASTSVTTQIKVTVSKVAGDNAGAGYEVAGTSPQVNSLLENMLKSSSMEGREELMAHAKNLIGFARVAVDAMSVAIE